MSSVQPITQHSARECCRHHHLQASSPGPLCLPLNRTRAPMLGSADREYWNLITRLQHSEYTNTIQFYTCVQERNMVTSHVRSEVIHACSPSSNGRVKRLRGPFNVLRAECRDGCPVLTRLIFNTRPVPLVHPTCAHWPWRLISCIYTARNLL